MEGASPRSELDMFVSNMNTMICLFHKIYVVGLII